jgi:pimeloyl-ACP methyl ester carboxylesterase
MSDYCVATTSERVIGMLRRMRRLVRCLLVAVGLCAIVFAALLAYPLSRPPVLNSIRDGALAVDQSGLPNATHFQASDGTSLAYRLYAAADGSDRTLAILIHGSAGGSTGMNEIAKRLAADNVVVVAPDVRGHGESGTRGDIGYIGQLGSDLADLVAELRRRYANAHFALLGFSSGGGFALRAAAGRLRGDFDRVVLVSPYLGYNAPSTRSSATSAQWADIDAPRILALAALRRVGLTCCEALPVIAFAVAPGSEKYVTPVYSYRLLINFSAPPGLAAAFRRLNVPTTIIAGDKDELMQSDKYSEVVSGVEPAVNVQILPGLGHMDMLHAPAALEAISAVFKKN